MDASDVQEADVLTLIDDLDELLSNAKLVPLSDQLRVGRDEVYALLDGIRATLPVAVKEARLMVNQRESVFTEAEQERERLLAHTRDETDRLTSDLAIQRLAERRADEILSAARRTAHDELLKVDEWAERILATLAPNFERFLQAIQRGRQDLLERSTKESAIDVEAP